MQQGAVKRSGRGRPRLRPHRLAGDQGYSSPTARTYLRRRGIRSVIPTLTTQRRDPHFDRAAYRERNQVERLIGRLKQCRRIATRYDKRKEIYHAFLILAAILISL
jgi:transposase